MESVPFEAKVFKVGNSKAVLLPSYIAKYLDIELEDRILLRIKKDKDNNAVLGFESLNRIGGALVTA